MLNCGGRADNRDAANHRGPLLPAAHQQRARGMLELQVSLPARTAPEFVTSAGCGKEDN